MGKKDPTQLETMVYSPLRGDEQSRLVTQGQLFTPLFKHLQGVQKQKWGSFKLALDIGCADGTVTRSWLGEYPSVIGVDISTACVQQAQQELAPSSSQFLFFQCDIEEPFAGDRLTEIMQRFSFPGEPALVLLSLSLHHLKDPVRVLKMLRESLAPGSLLLILTPDQDMTLAYPSDTLEKIISISKSAPVNQSDSQHGRKLPFQLQKAGFRDYYITEHVFSTMGCAPEKRLQIFSVFNSFHLEILERLQEAGAPDSYSSLQEMEGLLDNLRREFQDPSFFFRAVMFGALAEV